MSPTSHPVWAPRPSHPGRRAWGALGASALMAALAACSGGGGGGGNSAPAGPAPAFSTQPSSTTVVAGTQASFTVAASGSPTYQWKKNGTVIGGATSATYQTPATAPGDDNALFLAVATNGGGSTTSTGAVLRVNYVTIDAQPATASVGTGMNATFTVTASGSTGGTLSYQWKKDGTDIPGATATSYPLTNVGLGDAATYTCAVTGTLNGTTASATTAPAALNVAGAPSITTQPQSQTVLAGTSPSFTVAATGNGALSYQWEMGGTSIPGATGSTLTLPSVDGAYDWASLTCRVTNTVGTAAIVRTSAAATLRVVGIPVISAAPADATLFPGDAKTLHVGASGNGDLSYQWQKDGADLSGATSADLVLASIAPTDEGNYACVVSNTIDGVANTAASTAAHLTVQLNPAIITQPGNRSVHSSQSATFVVTAKGAALNYQWIKDGATIPGATSATFTTPSLSLADDGAQYWCVVSNGNPPDATSAHATLTVKPMVTTFKASATTVTPGEGVIFTYLFSNLATATFQDGANPAVSVTSGGNTLIHPTATQTYTLHVTEGGVTTDLPLTVTLKSYAPKWLYVVNKGSNDLYQYPVDTTAADPVGSAVGSPVATGAGPIHAVTTPDEKFMYVANFGDGTVSAYSLDAATGVPTPLATAPLSSIAASPWCSAVNPAGTRLYVACAEGIEAFTLDPATGALTPEPTLAVSIPGRLKGDMVIHPSGEFLFIADKAHSLLKSYAVDSATGALTFVSEVTTALGPTGLTFNRAANRLHLRGTSATTTYFGALNTVDLDPQTGILTPASTYEGFGANAGYSWAMGSEVDLAQVEGATDIQQDWDNDGVIDFSAEVHHGLAYSRRPGVDHLVNGWINTDPNLYNTIYSQYAVDPATGLPIGDTFDPATGYISPRMVNNWGYFGSGADAVVPDRSGLLFAVTLPYGTDRMIIYLSDPNGLLVPMGDMTGETMLHTGMDPVHACFTGTLQ
ncbi:MAG TPA: immunoglobulin domain-containing protein [Holophagaceae bacterium]|nr:immunoglobulin domain-containing protein [Holophagaceae bacterium]